MITALNINGYRLFEQLTIRGLRRVNVFVGRNNAGKTSVLEAVEALAGGGHPSTVLRGPRRREERPISYPIFDARPGYSLDLNIQHLFSGHALGPGSAFTISGNDKDEGHVRCEVSEGPKNAEAEMLFEEMDSASPLGLHRPSLKFTGSRFPEPIYLPISATGTIASHTIRAINPPSPQGTPSILVDTNLATVPLAALWDNVALTPYEGEVIQSLKLIEPQIERLAFVGADGGRSARRPVVRLSNNRVPVPIGSLGDGIRRLLTLSIVQTQVPGGYLLVDEIDTGLHHSALEQLWQLVTAGAHRNSTQVFATTHSSDCLKALGRACIQSKLLQENVALFRIDRGVSDAIRYDSSELEAAVRHHIETRG